MLTASLPQKSPHPHPEKGISIKPLEGQFWEMLRNQVEQS